MSFHVNLGREAPEVKVADSAGYFPASEEDLAAGLQQGLLHFQCTIVQGLLFWLFKGAIRKAPLKMI